MSLTHPPLMAVTLAGLSVDGAVEGKVEIELLEEILPITTSNFKVRRPAFVIQGVLESVCLTQPCSLRTSTCAQATTRRICATRRRPSISS